MEDLLEQNRNGKEVTTSIKIAQHFNISHADVVKQIDELNCTREFRFLNFEEMHFMNMKTNQMHRMYEVKREGLQLLVMNYTGEKARKAQKSIVKRFNDRLALVNDDNAIVYEALRIMQNRLAIKDNSFIPVYS